MKKTALLFLLISGVSSLAYRKNERGWRGIVPLHSNRADVERLLGSPHGECECLYKTHSGGVFVQYAHNRCTGTVPGGASTPHGWNVPPNTVLRFTVYSHNRKRFSDLNLDLSKYAMSRDDASTSYHANKEMGIEYEVSSDGTIAAISYIPSAKDGYLRCSGFSLEDGNARHYRPLDKYNDLHFDKEKIRLDGLAIALQHEQEMKGYIVAYSGRRSPAAEAKTRAERARKYLISERGIGPSLIVAIDGGQREDFTVELFALPKEAPAPIPTRTIAPKIKSTKSRNSDRSKPRTN